MLKTIQNRVGDNPRLDGAWCLLRQTIKLEGLRSRTRKPRPPALLLQGSSGSLPALNPKCSAA